MVNSSNYNLSTDHPGLDSDFESAVKPTPRLLDVLRGRKRLIFTSAFAGTVLFAAYALVTTPIYTAETLVVTNQPEFGQQASPLAASRETQLAALLSEIDLIQSSAFIARIVRQFDLTKDQEFDKSDWFAGWAGKINSATAQVPSRNSMAGSPTAYAWWLIDRLRAIAQPLFNDTATATDASDDRQRDVELARTVRIVGRHLTVVNDSHSVTIQVRFWSRDPQKASRLVNAFAANYVKDKLETKQHQSAEINTWLDSQMGGLRERVIAADRLVQAARQRFNINDTGPAATLSDQTLVQWNTALVAAQNKRLEAEARLATAKKVLTDQGPTQSTSDVLNSPLIQRLREQKGLLSGQYASIVFRSGPSYPQTVALKRQIDDLSDSIRTETQKILDSLANEVATAKEAEGVVLSAVGTAQKRASAYQMELAQIRELDQRAASERALYDEFLRKFNETLRGNYLPQSDVRVISPASPPDQPSYPKMALFAPAGFMLGMFFGVITALHSAGSNRTFRTSQAIEASTGLPTLGVIPLRPRQRARSIKGRATEIYFHQSIARVVAVLGQMGRPGEAPKVIAVTSALPQEGKTTFCAALARSVSGSGRRVLVIEFDRHVPGMAAVFRNFANSGDIMELLAGTKKIDEIVQRDPLSEVDFVPALRQASSTHQLISSTRMKSVFDLLRVSYDLILIDTAPVLANADISALADVIDTSLVVVRWGITPREAVTSALRQLRLLNVPATGVVLTGVNPAEANTETETKFYDQIIRYQ